MPENLLNKTLVSKYLGVSRQAFDKWGVQGVKRDGSQYLYSLRDVIDNQVDYELRKERNQCNLD
jgi:hypothetical protein